MDGGCNILHEADRCKAKTSGRRREPEQGNRRDNTGRGEKDIVPHHDGRKSPPPRRPQVEEIAGGSRKEEQRLHGEAGKRGGRDDLAQQSVERERNRQNQGNPWDRAEVQGKEKDTGAGQGQTCLLETPQPFAEKDETEKHGYKRIDEIAEARLEHLPMVHGHDKDKPVCGDEECGKTEENQRPGLPEDRADLSPLPSGGQWNQQGRQGPDNPVSKHLYRRHMGNPFEKEGKEPPEEVGGKAESDSLADLPVFGSVDGVQATSGTVFILTFYTQFFSMDARFSSAPHAYLKISSNKSRIACQERWSAFSL